MASAAKEETQATAADETQATPEKKEESKIDPSRVNEENLQEYLAQREFPASEYNKIAVKGIFGDILTSTEEDLRNGLRSANVNHFKIGRFIEAVEEIPGSKLNPNSQSNGM